LETDLLAIDDVILQTLLDRLTFRSFLRRLRLHAFEELRKLGERIVNADITFKLALVVDQLARDFQFLFTNAVEWLNLARINNRGIEAGFDCVVQKNGIQYYSGSGIQTK